MAGQETPPPEKGIAFFAARAVDHPADCKIAITEWRTLYETLTETLKSRGLSSSQIVSLVNDRLIAVCPDCHTWSGGQGLAMLATLGRAGGMIFGGATGGGERLAQGVCRNANCSCKDFLVFWKPDEDRDTIAILGRMGIEISPRT